MQQIWAKQGLYILCLLPDFGHFLGSTHDELVLASSPYPSLKGITFSYR